LPGPLPNSSYCLRTVEGGSEALGVMAIRITSDVLRGREIDGRLRREKIAAAPGGRFLGLVLLFSLETGELLAIMPDGIIQRLRVGASSALAADRWLAAALLGWDSSAPATRPRRSCTGWLSSASSRACAYTALRQSDAPPSPRG